MVSILHHLLFIDMVLGVEGGYDSEDREEAEIYSVRPAQLVNKQQENNNYKEGVSHHILL